MNTPKKISQKVLCEQKRKKLVLSVKDVKTTKSDIEKNSSKNPGSGERAKVLNFQSILYSSVVTCLCGMNLLVTFCRKTFNSKSLKKFLTF